MMITMKVWRNETKHFLKGRQTRKSIQEKKKTTTTTLNTWENTKNEKKKAEYGIGGGKEMNEEAVFVSDGLKEANEKKKKPWRRRNK